MKPTKANSAASGPTINQWPQFAHPWPEIGALATADKAVALGTPPAVGLPRIDERARVAGHVASPSVGAAKPFTPNAYTFAPLVATRKRGQLNGNGRRMSRIEFW